MNSITLDGIDITPSKILCIGRNYVDHIKELNNEIPSEPVIFLIPNSSISKHLCTVESTVLHYEGEITFLIQSGELYAIGFGLDLTKRELQTELKNRGLPWERAKAFDNSAVFSDFTRFSGNVADLRMELYINDTLKQQGSYKLMLNKPDSILDEVKPFITLVDGDLLMTGTPKGVGAIHIGDVFCGRILENDTLLIESTWVVK